MASIREFLADLFRPVIRTFGFLTKEVLGVVRQPRLIASLVLGPFLILLVFGLGFRGQLQEFQTVLVVPDEISTDREQFEQAFGTVFKLQEVTRDRAAAEQKLASSQTDVVVEVPPNVVEQVTAGNRAPLTVLFSQTDPIASTWVRYFAYVQTTELNRRILVTILQRFQVPHPETLVSPFDLEARNLVPVEPTQIAFYTPAVLALVLQHTAVTLGMLSAVRDRLLGTMELFRVAPVGSGSILIGRSLGFGLLLTLVGVALTAAATALLGVPLLGDPLLYWLALGSTIFAALGLGLALAHVAHTESQAVQLSMLVLLASVFFGGFFMSLEQLFPWVHVISYALPVTYGAADLREVMLRGSAPPPALLYGPLALGLLFYLISALGLRREMRRA
jgi:ABC-2 type transport system permease protein